jgi:hypothetical protein
MNEVLKRKIINRESGILLYGITPPKENNTDERIIEISQKHVTRIKEMDIDGLVLYDIQDESDRTQEARTFEFIKTVDPSVYSRVYMKDIKSQGSFIVVQAITQKLLFQHGFRCKRKR